MRITVTNIVSKIIHGVIFVLLGINVFGQTNPTAQPVPYVQDFGNNWFLISGLPQGFTIWTASGAPCTLLAAQW